MIPEMAPHYEMQPLMVPVHPDFQHDPARNYHIAQVQDGTMDAGYSDIPLRVGYYTQSPSGEHPDMYRHNIGVGNHWPSPPPTSQRERLSNNNLRREKRPESADSSYSGAHSDSNQMYSSRYDIINQWF